MKAFLALIGLVALLLATPAFAGPCAAGGCDDPSGFACDLCLAAHLGAGCGSACVTPPLAPAFQAHAPFIETTARFAAFAPDFSDAVLRPEAPPPR